MTLDLNARTLPCAKGFKTFNFLRLRDVFQRQTTYRREWRACRLLWRESVCAVSFMLRLINFKRGAVRRAFSPRPCRTCPTQRCGRLLLSSISADGALTNLFTSRQNPEIVLSRDALQANNITSSVD